MALAKAIESEHIPCDGNKIIVGHALDVLKTLPSESVDCVVTSPPYWGLRDYHTEPVEWSDGWVGQLGLEPTHQLYIKHLVSIFDEVKRVLKPSGTCWVNLGDSYANSAGPNNRDSKKARDCPVPDIKMDIDLPDKCLVQIPSRFAIAMTDAGWILRNEIIWHKPNAMPSSVKDRFTVDFEKLFFFVKSKRYYFEQQFEPMSEASVSRYKYKFGGTKNEAIKEADNPTYVVGMRSPTDGRNKRTVWTITTKAYRGAHFAVFPPELVETPIKAGCPPGGVVLDPFGGTGTTAAVAKQLGRNSIMIELNPNYIPLMEERVGDSNVKIVDMLGGAEE
jgi:site-specific DNA-methyltransferase (cytosine-N4-specific)